MSRVAECRNLESRRWSPIRLVPSGWMVAEAEFGVTYDGPALEAGQMPVADLAPALLSLGALFTEASNITFPERDPASLNIRATDRGSFHIWLTLQSPEAWEQVVTLLSGKIATALTNLQAIIFDTGGLLWLMKSLAGRTVASRTGPLESGLVRLTLSDGTVIEALPEALALYERAAARKNARKVVEPLYRPGVDRLEFRREKEPEPDLVVEKDDLGAYEQAEPDEELLHEEEREAFVALAVASVDGDYKWRFSEGDTIVTASLEDPSFRARIEAGEAFRKGDMFRLRLRVVQTKRGDKLQVERTVIEVLDHIPRQVQTDIFSLDEDDE